jgi:hypothetical protein
MPIFNLLGGRLTFLNIFLFIFWLLLPLKYFKNKIFRITYLFICYIIITAQIISLLITGQFIGYEFIVHTNFYDITSMMRLYPHSIIIILFFSIIYFMPIIFSQKFLKFFL